MTPELKRLLFPLRAPRVISRMWQPVHAWCDGVRAFVAKIKEAKEYYKIL